MKTYRTFGIINSIGVENINYRELILSGNKYTFRKCDIKTRNLLERYHIPFHKNDFLICKRYILYPQHFGHN